jgi:hypothetical protein
MPTQPSSRMAPHYEHQIGLHGIGARMQRWEYVWRVRGATGHRAVLQVMDQKVRGFVGTHGPRLMEITRLSAPTVRPRSSLEHPSHSRGGHRCAHKRRGASAPARKHEAPGGTSRPHNSPVMAGGGPDRGPGRLGEMGGRPWPVTAQAAVQAAARAEEELFYSMAHKGAQRRIRCVSARCDHDNRGGSSNGNAMACS